MNPAEQPMSDSPFSLDGKTILVTGASSGIGRAAALLCAQLGATIIACGRNAERLQQTLRAVVPGLDHALRRGANDGVAREGNQSGEQRL